MSEITAVQQAPELSIPHDPTLRVEFSVNKLRLMGGAVRKTNGFSTEQAQAFLSLYRGEFEERLNAAAREFIEEKLA
jgi:hypothetical protein